MIVILVGRMMIMISMKVSEFSQQDINDGRILFKHKVGELDRIGWKIGGWRSRLWDLLTATHSGFQLWQDSHLGEWRPGDQCLKLYKSNKAPHHSPAQSIPETNFQPQPVSDNSRDLAPFMIKSFLMRFCLPVASFSIYPPCFSFHAIFIRVWVISIFIFLHSCGWAQSWKCERLPPLSKWRTTPGSSYRGYRQNHNDHLFSEHITLSSW